LTPPFGEWQKAENSRQKAVGSKQKANNEQKKGTDLFSYKPMTTDDSTIVRQLEDLAETFRIQIRYEPIRMDDDLPTVPGSVCRFKGDNILIINSNATMRDKLKTLAEAIKNFDLDQVYILRSVKELLEKARECFIKWEHRGCSK
jgi:hypothetical protein